MPLIKQEASLPLAKSSSSFLFVEVDGSFATKAGLAFACSAACEKIIIIYLGKSTTHHLRMSLNIWSNLNQLFNERCHI